jgi:hypothetical protein
MSRKHGRRSSSRERGVKNVITAAQHLLIGGRCAPLIKRRPGIKSYDAILAALRA